MQNMSDPTSSPLPEDDEISLLDLLQVVVDNLRLLVLGPLACGLLALGASFLIAPTFTAEVQFMPPQQQQSAAAGLLQNLGALGGLAGAAGGIKNPADQYLSFVQSRSVEDALIDRFKLMERYNKEFKDDARKTLEQRVRATAGKKDGLIVVQVDDTDPEFAATLANAHVEELRKLMARLAVTEAQQRRLFFEKQLEDVKTKLITAEQALKATGVNAGTLKTSPAAAVAELASLKAAITGQEIKLANLRSFLTDNAPELKLAMVELAALKEQFNKAQSKEANLSNTTAGQDQYIGRYRDYKYFETLFEIFSKQYELARVDESREGAVIQVVDAAIAPERKSKPKKALIAILTTLATGFALLLWVFVRNALANAATQPETATKLAQIKRGWGRAWGR